MLKIVLRQATARVLATRLVAFGLVVAAGMTACQSSQPAKTKRSTVPTEVCPRCYEEIVAAREITSSSASGKRKSKRDEVLRHQFCVGCKSEMTIFTEGGVLTFWCASCAPDGVACDLCSPKAAAPSASN